jgi:hypothetical protein
LDVLGLDGGLAARQKAAVLEFDRRCRIGLDDRQVEVLVLALRGKDRSEIAAALGRSLGAVKSRLLKILERFRRAGFAVVGLSDVLILIREAPAVLDEKLQAIIGRGGRS